MSQIEFTSACAGDIGVTLENLAGSPEVITIAFIKSDPNTHVITHVNVHDIRKGGRHTTYGTLAEALQNMLVLADNYRTLDMERQIEEHIAAKKAFGRAVYEGRFTDDPRHPNLIIAEFEASYFASNKSDPR